MRNASVNAPDVAFRRGADSRYSPRASIFLRVAGLRRDIKMTTRYTSLKEPTTTLWRPVGPKELELIQRAGMVAFPPRLPEQPIFYPVLSEEYAIKIARDWNVPESGSGFVTRFEVKSSYLSQYAVQEAGGRAHLEYWIPADDMDAFNAAIVGRIEVVREFR